MRPVSFTMVNPHHAFSHDTSCSLPRDVTLPFALVFAQCDSDGNFQDASTMVRWCLIPCLTLCVLLSMSVRIGPSNPSSPFFLSSYGHTVMSVLIVEPIVSDLSYAYIRPLIW